MLTRRASAASVATARSALANVSAGVVLSVLAAGGLYVGLAAFMTSKALEDVSASTSDKGSYDYQGINFENASELRVFLKQERLGRWFPWAPDLPFELIPLALAAAFGLLGGTVAILKMVALDRMPVKRLTFISRPLFGMAIGVMFFAMSFLLPALFTTGHNQARTESIMGLSLFGGLFAQRSYDWVEEQISKYFKERVK